MASSPMAKNIYLLNMIDLIPLCVFQSTHEGKNFLFEKRSLSVTSYFHCYPVLCGHLRTSGITMPLSTKSMEFSCSQEALFLSLASPST